MLPVNYNFQSQRKKPVDVCLFKGNNENTKLMYEICSKLAIKTPGRDHLYNKDTRTIPELVCLFLTLNR